MEQQSPVGDALDVDAVLPADRVHDPGDVRLVDREHRHVAHLLAVLEPDDVDRVERAACLSDRGGQPGEGAGPVVEVHAERGAERGGGVRDSHPLNVHRRPVGRIGGAPEAPCGLPAGAGRLTRSALRRNIPRPLSGSRETI